MLCIIRVMVHPTNHIQQICKLHCDFCDFVELVIDTSFYPFLLYMVRPTKSLTNVGLAQGCPNQWKPPFKIPGSATKVLCKVWSNRATLTVKFGQLATELLCVHVV